MKQFGKIKLRNRDYKYITEKYIKFYESENKCSDTCPIFEDGEKSELAFELFETLYGAPLFGECFCCQLPMFPDTDCPCHIMKEKAFVALEEFIKEIQP